MDLIPFINALKDAGAGELGKTLFIQTMPSGCRKGVLLRAPLVGVAIDPELPGFYKTDGITAVVRAPNVAEGSELCRKVMETFSFQDTRQMLPYTVRYMRPRTLPIMFPLSDGGMIEWQIKLSVCFAENES